MAGPIKQIFIQRNPAASNPVNTGNISNSAGSTTFDNRPLNFQSVAEKKDSLIMALFSMDDGKGSIFSENNPELKKGFADLIGTIWMSKNKESKDKAKNEFIEQMFNADMEDDGEINNSILNTSRIENLKQNNMVRPDIITDFNNAFAPLKLIYMLLDSIKSADYTDNGKIDGSVYSSPGLRELLPEIDRLDDGEINGSINNLMQDMNSTDEIVRNKAVSSMEGLEEKRINSSFEKFKGQIPVDRPEFIKEADWKKIKDLDPQMQAKVVELYTRAKEKGIDTNKINVFSGLRSRAQQEAIYKSARKGYAAKPGMSQHELGRAVDIKADKETKAKLGKIWEDMGFKWGQRFSRAPEDWHFDLRSK